jgi:hypothetical protein
MARDFFNSEQVLCAALRARAPAVPVNALNSMPVLNASETLSREEE